METTLKVTGMTCEHCEKSTKSALESLSGVSSVVVHLETGNVDVTYEENQVSIAELKEAIEDQGYEVA